MRIVVSERRIAEEKGIEVHGVLWATDEMEAQGIVPVEVLHNCDS